MTETLSIARPHECEALLGLALNLDSSSVAESPPDSVYFEATPSGARVCRIERFSEILPAPLAAHMVALCKATVEEAGFHEIALLKEKINLKWPGGRGYLAHQDAVAYFEWGQIITVAVALTHNSLEGGCLWLADDPHGTLRTSPRGTIYPGIAEALTFHPCILQAGEGVLLSGTRPHLSGINEGTSLRALALVTFVLNPPSDDVRSQYYAQRAAVLADLRHPSLSVIDDFDGTLTGAPSEVRQGI